MLPESPRFIRAGTLRQLSEKGFIHLRIMGKPVSVFVGEDGEPFATEMSCKHQGASLAAGAIRGRQVTCARHGWKYDLHTGVCLNADSPPLRRHAVKIEGEDILVAFYPEAR